MNKIIIKLKTNPRLFSFIAIMTMAVSIASLTMAATSITVLPVKAVINSANSTSTNSHFGTTTNGIWPIGIVGGDILTNLTFVDVSAWKDVTIETSCALQAAAGLVPGQQVVWTIYKNVASGSPTNATGTGLILEKAGTITNAFAISAPAGSNSVSSLTLNGGNGGLTQLGLAGQLGGVTALYIGICDASTVTNNGTWVTNFSVWVNGK